MDKIDSIIQYTIASTNGWCGASGKGLRPLAEMIANFGDGDHVEIGSLFGASAILAAKVKKEYNLEGTIYCIDPMIFDEHEACIRIEGTVSEKLMLRHQEQIFKDNVRKWDNIKFIRARSYPWPFDKDKKFNTAFIDGWHYDDGPLNDAKTMVDVVDQAILLDDTIPEYPDIHKAFMYLCEHPDWYPFIKLNRSTMFQRYAPKVVFTKTGTVPLITEISCA